MHLVRFHTLSLRTSNYKYLLFYKFLFTSVMNKEESNCDGMVIKGLDHRLQIGYILGYQDSRDATPPPSPLHLVRPFQLPFGTLCLTSNAQKGQMDPPPPP